MLTTTGLGDSFELLRVQRTQWISVCPDSRSLKTAESLKALAARPQHDVEPCCPDETWSICLLSRLACEARDVKLREKTRRGCWNTKRSAATASASQHGNEMKRQEEQEQYDFTAFSIALPD